MLFALYNDTLCSVNKEFTEMYIDMDRNFILDMIGTDEIIEKGEHLDFCITITDKELKRETVAHTFVGDDFFRYYYKVKIN